MDLGARSKSARRTRRKPVGEQRFANYMYFGTQSTCCLGMFLLCYIIVQLSLWPLLSSPTLMEDETASDGNGENIHNHHHHHHQLPKVMDQLHAAHVPGQEKISQLASAAKQQLQQLRQGRGVTDSALLKEADAEFELLRKKKQQQQQQGQQQVDNGMVDAVANPNNQVNADSDQRPGFIVLGMHRSGTSMLSGLLVTSCGYKVGGPLIGAHFDNEKGFFERIDIVLQNDEFMNHQHVWWSANVINYDYQQALDDKESGAITFKNGETGLAFLNDPNNAPWLQKDPRMCITLKTWLKLMNSEPAIVFTYRHPLEVAMSLKKREKNISLDMGLRLWIVYNMRAIQNSQGLCRVLSSNEALLADPLNEVQRISDEVTSKCGVPPPPQRVAQEDVDKFVDPNLQHNKKQRELGDTGKVLDNHDGCIVHDYESDRVPGTPQAQREEMLYQMAMKIYCDFGSGTAYQDDYEWPKLP